MNPTPALPAPMPPALLDKRFDAFGYGFKVRAHRLLVTLEMMEPDDLGLLREGLSRAHATLPAANLRLFAAFEQLVDWASVDWQDRDLDDGLQVITAEVLQDRVVDDALRLLLAGSTDGVDP